jgi:hypothetical protein
VFVIIVYVSPPPTINIFTMVAAPPDTSTLLPEEGVGAKHEKQRMQPLGKESSSRGDIVTSSFDSVLIERNNNGTPKNIAITADELVPTTIQLEKDHHHHNDVVVVKKQRKQQQQMICSSPPLNNNNDDPTDNDVSTDNDTVASMDVVSSSGSGEVSYTCFNSSSSQGSNSTGPDASSHDYYTEEEEDDDEVVVTATDTVEDHPAEAVQHAVTTDATAIKKGTDAPATDASFAALRWSYLIVTLVIMLADGLQGK